VAESLEALELFDGAAEKPFRLRLIAEEEREGIGLAEEAAEAFGQAVAAILGGGDLDVVDHVVMEKDEGPAIGVEDLVEAGGIEAALNAGADDERLLGEGHALDGEKLLRIDGPVARNEVGAEVVDGIELLDADDREVGAFEGVIPFDWGLRGGGFGGGGGFPGHRVAFRDEQYHAGERGLGAGWGWGLRGKEIEAGNCWHRWETGGLWVIFRSL
jgi:hypothetical protein